MRPILSVLMHWNSRSFLVMEGEASANDDYSAQFQVPTRCWCSNDLPVPNHSSWVSKDELFCRDRTEASWCLLGPIAPPPELGLDLHWQRSILVAAVLFGDGIVSAASWTTSLVRSQRIIYFRNILPWCHLGPGANFIRPSGAWTYSATEIQ